MVLFENCEASAAVCESSAAVCVGVICLDGGVSVVVCVVDS